MNERLVTDRRLLALREAGAAARDAVTWHYIEVLAARTQAQTGAARPLLQHRLDKALDEFEARLDPLELASQARPAPARTPSPSPLALLLQDMASPAAASTASPAAGSSRAENPRVRQLRTQLRKISLQKQVSQAIAQAPQNAGPINSHMLVLRALGLMREISPDYLNRFMAYADTLLNLEEAGQSKPAPRRAPAAGKTRR
ncbi:MAG: DUF2894 domain-containing protein [Limnohabitans sp.]